MYHPFKWWIAGLVHGRARLLPDVLWAATLYTLAHRGYDVAIAY
jgi:hypothetical protein